MRFRLYREYGALNSRPVFDAFEQGLKTLGHTVVAADEDVSVIWSILWSGRMLPNRKIYHEAIKNNKPIIIIEVGNLLRNNTWRVGLNHINGLGIFGNDVNLDNSRPTKLGIQLQPERSTRRKEILIAAQHQQSLQWEDQKPMAEWVHLTVNQIKQYSDRPIVVRSHPRSRLIVPGINVEVPQMIPNTYDSFDFDHSYHCVINHNSGPTVQAAVQGIPVICDQSGLAYPVSSTFNQIESIALPNREEWFLKLCHTEWTVSEIAQGIPLKRLEKFLVK